MKVFLR
jgi:hypothetical protein